MKLISLKESLAKVKMSPIDVKGQVYNLVTDELFCELQWLLNRVHTIIENGFEEDHGEWI
jgi:allantoicase